MLPAREVAAVVPENDAVYRRQLVEEMRMCVKGLVALCHQRQGDCLDDSTGQVDTLCLTMEKILRHGLKDKSNFFTKKDYFNFVEQLARHEWARNAVQSVAQLSHVKTLQGRGRAWVCFALVEKKLEEYLRALTDMPDNDMPSWYESYGLLRVREEMDMLLATLAPLSLVDFDICLKDIDFDNILQQRALTEAAHGISGARSPPSVTPRTKQQYKRHTAYSFECGQEGAHHPPHHREENGEPMSPHDPDDDLVPTTTTTITTTSSREEKRRTWSLVSLPRYRPQEPTKHVGGGPVSPLSQQRPPSPWRPAHWTQATLPPPHASSSSSLSPPSSPSGEAPPQLPVSFSPLPTLEELRAEAVGFGERRGWGRHQQPQNLLLALVGEVGEVSECFQWKTCGEAAPGLPGFTSLEKEHLAEELSDVLIYLLLLSDKCGVDLPTAAAKKLRSNALKYPLPAEQLPFSAQPPEQSTPPTPEQRLPHQRASVPPHWCWCRGAGRRDRGLIRDHPPALIFYSGTVPMMCTWSTSTGGRREAVACVLPHWGIVVTKKTQTRWSHVTYGGVWLVGRRGRDLLRVRVVVVVVGGGPLEVCVEVARTVEFGIAHDAVHADGHHRQEGVPQCELHVLDQLPREPDCPPIDPQGASLPLVGPEIQPRLEEEECEACREGREEAHKKSFPVPLDERLLEDETRLGGGAADGRGHSRRVEAHHRRSRGRRGGGGRRVSCLGGRSGLDRVAPPGQHQEEATCGPRPHTPAAVHRRQRRPRRRRARAAPPAPRHRDQR